MATGTADGGGRYYIWPNEDRTRQLRLWSVTTIIDKGIPKDALKWWAARTVAEWSVDNLPTLQTMMRRPIVETFRPIHLERIAEFADSNGEVDPAKLKLLLELAKEVAVDPEAMAKARDEAIELAKGAPRRTTKRAAIKGSHVHDAIEAYQLERPYPGVPDVVRGQYNEFLRFLNDHRPIVEQTEAKIYNRTRLYAGRLDAIMLFPSLAQAIEKAGLWTPSEEEPHPRVMVDVKTSGSGVYPEVGLQLSAYDNAEFIGGPDGLEYPMPKVHAAVVLWLPADGEYELLPIGIKNPDVFRAFLYAFEILRWAEEISKGVISKPVPRPMLTDPVAEFERLRTRERDYLEVLAKARRLRQLGDERLAEMSDEELALAIIWDRATPDVVLRYAPTHPCPVCGWQVDKVRHRNANTPKWKCSNDACRGGERKGKVWPWASWESEWEAALEKWKQEQMPPGQTARLQPKVADEKKAAPDDEPESAPEQATLAVDEEATT